MKSAAKVLIVEDESIVALDLEQQLLDLGYAVPAILASGEQAVAYTQNDTPDLILMDIQLQDEMDGITAVKEIKKTIQVPVIYLTAFADQATLYRARETEPHGYLVKPFNDETLRTTVEMALHKFQSERRLQNYASELEQKNLLLQLLNRLVKADMQISTRKDMLRLACNGLLDSLNIPYSFAIAFENAGNPHSILFERLKAQPQITSTELSNDTHQITRNYFTHKKPWIAQNVQHIPSLDILKQLKAAPFIHELFVLPIVLEDDIVGVIGLGANRIEDISVNDIRAAWNVVSEIVHALESVNTTGSQQRLLEIFFHSNICIVYTDQNGIIEFVNPAFEKNIGYHLPEISGHPLFSAPIFSHSTNHTQNEALQMAFSQGKSWFGKLVIQQKDRGAVCTQVALWPIFNQTQGEIVGDIQITMKDNVPSISNFICFIQTHYVSSDKSNYS